jgi:carbon-monoxide dehydrogenase medium subunit
MYAFNYEKPTSTEQATQLITEDSRYLAGGQSLIQSMKLRLASAENLVDLSGIDGLVGISKDGTAINIGAMTTHATVNQSADVIKSIPALADMAGGIGDQMVRNMGTIGGSLANSDPAACYPAALLALKGTVKTNKQSIDSDSFFKGLFETALEPGELIESVSFEIPEKAAYVKFKQPASRFALVGVMVAKYADGARVAATGAREHAFRIDAFEAALNKDFSEAALEKLELPADGCNADLHGSAQYRAAMVGVMARRAVAAALA